MSQLTGLALAGLTQLAGLAGLAQLALSSFSSGVQNLQNKNTKTQKQNRNRNRNRNRNTCQNIHVKRQASCCLGFHGLLVLGGDSLFSLGVFLIQGRRKYGSFVHSGESHHLSTIGLSVVPRPIVNLSNDGFGHLLLVEVDLSSLQRILASIVKVKAVIF